MASWGDLLHTEALALVAVVRRREGEPVRWVATTELPDPTPYLEGAQIVLTTGLETAAWSGAWDGYVARLVRAGVVALGLGLGLTHEAVPDALRNACEEHGLDLFTIPRETAFVAVSRTFARLVQAEEEAAAKAALETHRALARAAMAELGSTAILRELARSVPLVAVVAADGELEFGPAGVAAGLFDLEEVEKTIRRIRPNGVGAAGALARAEGHVAVHPIGLRGRPARYLVTGSVDGPDLLHRGVAATAVCLLSLAEERVRAGRQADRELRSRALELVAAGDVETARVLLEATTPSRGLPRSAVVLRARATDADHEDALAVFEQDAEVAGLLDGDVVAVVRPSRVEARRAALVGLGLRVGVGEVVDRADLAIGLDGATRAVELSSVQTPSVAWGERTRGGVLGLLAPDQAEAFGRTYLAPVRELGAESGTLLATLDSFLVHHGSVGRVAEHLGIHRNTVRNRVERLEQVLGRSLDDPQVRADAWVALRSVG